MTKYRSFSPEDRLPSTYPDALGEFLSGAVENFLVRIKPTDLTVLQVPAGTDNAQVSIAINGMWRYNSSTVERASPGGSARTLDVFVTGTANSFTVGAGGEVDTTDYSFGLAIVESGATPTGVALSRKVATVMWDGTKFVAITMLVPAIGGVSSDQLAAETSARQAADAFQVVHVATWDDQTSPAQPAGSVIAEVPAPIVTGQTLSLVGVMSKCSTVGATPSVFKVQTDNGSGTGVLANVTGLAAVQPAAGRFVEADATPTISLARGDSIALVLVTPGNSKGCKVALLFARTA